MSVLGTKIEVEAQPLAELWAQFAANRCGIQRLFILSLQIFGERQAFDLLWLISQFRVFTDRSNRKYLHASSSSYA